MAQRENAIRIVRKEKSFLMIDFCAPTLAQSPAFFPLECVDPGPEMVPLFFSVGSFTCERVSQIVTTGAAPRNRNKSRSVS